ncbi:MAG: EAL domain-containing protein [Thiobacillus sp.]
MNWNLFRTSATGKLKTGLLLLALFTALTAGLLLPSVMGGVERLEELRARMERLQLAESRFREQVIALHHGVAGNYDEANGWMTRIKHERAGLAAEMAQDITVHRIWMNYYKANQNQEALWDDFKQRNALVSNSLRYFQSDAPAFAATLPPTGLARSLHHELMLLNNVLFMQALEEGKVVASEVRNALSRMQGMASLLPPAEQMEFENLARHAEIIGENVPVLETDLRALIHGDGRSILMQLADLNHRQLLDEHARTARYRAGLLVGMAIIILALILLSTRFLESLQQRDKELRLAGTVFESSHQGILMTDTDGKIVRVNTAYCQMTGYEAHELLGQNPRILNSGKQDRDFYQAMWESLKTKGRWVGEMRNRRKNGDLYVQWINIDAVNSEKGEKLFVGIATDISELVDTRERLTRLAYYDPLTTLPNRVLFQDRLTHAISQCRRDEEKLALILVDLDNFKTVNDTLGHATGDEMLKEVARRLLSRVRESDTVARLGGDEFALILIDAREPESIARVAGEIINVLAAPYQIMGYEVAGCASLGITFYPDDGQTPEELLKQADVAMYRAKEYGRNNYQFYTADMAAGVADSMQIEYCLRRALDTGELSMHYQPQLSAEGRLVGAEALMRWDSAELGRVPPMRFIPVAERSGLIVALGNFALREASRQCAAWRNAIDPNFRISVNLSAAQFRNETLVDKVAEALHEYGLPGSALELEITETVVMEDVARGQAVLKRLKEKGCRLAIDDFGTGYSSLAYLKRFPVDVLKIDKSFIDGLGEEADDTAVVQAIIGLAKSLRMEVVAEGVETAGQFESLLLLTQADGFLAQGYYFAPPLQADVFEQQASTRGFLPLLGHPLSRTAHSAML